MNNDYYCYYYYWKSHYKQIIFSLVSLTERKMHYTFSNKVPTFYTQVIEYIYVIKYFWQVMFEFMHILIYTYSSF